MIKTHTFRFGKYQVAQASRIDGVCDTPNDDTKGMVILDGNDFRSLNSALHEAMHAEGIPDEYIHDKEGFSDTERIARFLWRLGYRKVDK